MGSDTLFVCSFEICVVILQLTFSGQLRNKQTNKQNHLKPLLRALIINEEKKKAKLVSSDYLQSLL